MNRRIKWWFTDFKVHKSTCPNSTLCVSPSVWLYNQSQSISSNHRVVNHYKDVHFMNIWCKPSALDLVPLRRLGSGGYRADCDNRKALSSHTFGGAAKLGVLWENNVRDASCFRNVQPPLSFFYSTMSTGAVLLWVSFLLLGQMKTSWSFVARVFLHSLNQPTASCSACGVALVLVCSSSSSSPSSSSSSPKTFDHKPRCYIISDKISGPFIRSDTFYWRRSPTVATGQL